MFTTHPSSLTALPAPQVTITLSGSSTAGSPYTLTCKLVVVNGLVVAPQVASSPGPVLLKLKGGKTGPGRHCQGRSAHALVCPRIPFGNHSVYSSDFEFREAVAYSLTNEIRRAAYAIAKSDEYTEGNYGYPRYSGTN